MFTVLGCLFLEERVFSEKKVWNLLTAWYWGAVFSGRYDKDQNVQADRDLRNLRRIIRGEQDVRYLQDMQKDMMKVPYFSSVEFLLFESGTESGIFPKEALAQYICQFYLSEGYMDLFSSNRFLCTFSKEDGEDELEKHHIVPLMSDQIRTIAESEKALKREAMKRTIVNSPVNRIYITRNTNRTIGAKDFTSYLAYVDPTAVRALDLPTESELRKIDPSKPESVRDFLRQRHEAISNHLQQSMENWLRDWKEQTGNEGGSYGKED